MYNYDYSLETLKRRGVGGEGGNSGLLGNFDAVVRRSL